MSDIYDILNEAAAAYGANAKVLTNMARLESGFKTNAVNRTDSNARAGTPSEGILQFIKPTFDSFAKQARDANPKAWQGVSMNWLDPKAQALAASWAITHGHSGDWTTYKRALSASGSPGAGQPQPSGLGLSAPVNSSPSGTFGGTLDYGSLTKDSEFASLLNRNRQLLQKLGQPSAQTMAPAPAGGSMPVSSDGDLQVSGGPGHSWKSIVNWAKNNFGAQIQGSFQTTGGDHAVGSLHYAGKAVDYGDANTSRKQFNEIAAYARAHPNMFKEFYFNPLGWGIKNGKIIKGLTVEGHDDHMHIGVY